MKENKKPPIHHPHNNLFEQAFSNPSVMWDFLKGRLDPSVTSQLDAKTLKLESASFVDEKLKKHYSDLVMSARLANKKSYIYFLIEHQTKNEKHMMLRLLEYNIKLMRRHINQGEKKLPTIINFVLYTGKSRYTGERSILDAFEAPKTFIDWLKRKVVIELAQEDDRRIIQDEKASLAELVLKYRSIVDAFNALQNELGLNASLVISNLHYWLSALYYAIEVGEDKPEDIIKKISTLDPTKQQQTMTTLQILTEQGKKEGIKLGTQQGIKLGEERGKKAGAKQEKMQIAKSLLKQGVLIHVIQGATGLSTKELNKLKDDL